ncbi:MAG: hypothetical protein FJZ11_00245 [Candidatus Omnitrophica bacterium]|nr:hypothetical protein [Candidatus Omnitrophota bacterium]
MENKIRRKEEIFGFFAAVLAGRLPDRYKPLIFSSPVCARDASSGQIWHPCFINSNLFIKIIKTIPEIIYAFIIGAIKITIQYKPSYIVQIGQHHDILIVATNQIVAKGATNTLRTPYLNIVDESKVDWLILNYGSKSESFNFKKFSISRIQMLKIDWGLFKESFGAFIYCLGVSKDKFILTEAFLLFSVWALRQGWVSAFALEEILKKLNAQYKYKIFFSPHEMHPYSRALWFWSKKFGLKSVALQHAVIHRNKLLFFPTQEERLAGLATPDIFYIFSQKYLPLLKPYMPDTRFIIGSSPRFSNRINLEELFNDKDKELLIITSTCWFDIRSMLSLAGRLLNGSCAQKKITVRLHPYGNYAMADFFKIQFLKWIKRVNFSAQTLKQDLEKSWMVLGCGSSVIFEAMLCGIPTVLVSDARFANFELEGLFIDNIMNGRTDFVNWEFLNDIAGRSNLGRLQEESQDLLGIKNTKVDSAVINDLQNERAAHHE